MEASYEQVEDAINRKLHLGAPAKALSIHGMHWHYPVAIEGGNVVMRDSDCGLAKPTWTITIAEWADRVEIFGLWKKVGFWDFAKEDDPAAGDIRYCHANPQAAGRMLYELRQRVAALTEATA